LFSYHVDPSTGLFFNPETNETFTEEQAAEWAKAEPEVREDYRNERGRGRGAGAGAGAGGGGGREGGGERGRERSPLPCVSVSVLTRESKL